MPLQNLQAVTSVSQISTFSCCCIPADFIQKTPKTSQNRSNRETCSNLFSLGNILTVWAWGQIVHQLSPGRYESTYFTFNSDQLPCPHSSQTLANFIGRPDHRPIRCCEGCCSAPCVKDYLLTCRCLHNQALCSFQKKVFLEKHNICYIQNHQEKQPLLKYINNDKIFKYSSKVATWITYKLSVIRTSFKSQKRFSLSLHIIICEIQVILNL